MRWADDAAIGIAGLVTLAIVLAGCAHREPLGRACSEAQAAVEFCERGSCGGSKMKNRHGSEWPTLEEWERQAEQVCAAHRAAGGR